MAASIGQTAPNFSLPDQDGNKLSLEDLRGDKTLLVFIPFAFTGVCQGELCELRDALKESGSLDARVVAVTCNAKPTNAAWAKDQGYEFPILSDFWPHGVTSKAYGSFNEQLGCANRYTFVIDPELTVRDIIKTDSLGTAREMDAYQKALAAI